MLISKHENIFELVDNYLKENKKIDCILVDEVQFMKSKQIDQLFEIAVNIDIPIICYGLRTDFKRDGFEGSTRLLLLAHSIEEMKTICACGKKAIFNGRKINVNLYLKENKLQLMNKIMLNMNHYVENAIINIKKNNIRE